jgi:hypothetical protein
MKQATLEETTQRRSSIVTQEDVNRLIVNFVVSDMQSLSVVEQPTFIDLVTGLAPGRSVMTRKTLTSTQYLTLE